MIPSSYVALFIIVSIHHIIHRLLTPPATPLCFPAATSGPTAALNRLTRATSASYAKSNSPVHVPGRSIFFHPRIFVCWNDCVIQTNEVGTIV
jgi:hypothetical protein